MSIELTHEQILKFAYTIPSMMTDHRQAALGLHIAQRSLSEGHRPKLPAMKAATEGKLPPQDNKRKGQRRSVEAEEFLLTYLEARSATLAQILDNTGLARSTTYRAIKFLLADGRIKEQPCRRGKAAIYMGRNA